VTQNEETTAGTNGSKVQIYASMFCGYCHKAKRLLKGKGIDFQEIDVTMDAVKRQEMIQRSGGRTSVPQVFVNDRHIGDCNEIYALEAEGRLTALLQGQT
jgi:glutaredoxin 3